MKKKSHYLSNGSQSGHAASGTWRTPLAALRLLRPFLFLLCLGWAATASAQCPPDGVNWTARTAAEGSWSSVTYGTGLVVAAADGGANRVMTSPDGVTPSVSIAADPGNSIAPGTEVTFTATPTNGGSTPAYQWKKNNTNVGTNSPTYMDKALADGDVITVVMTSADPTSAPSSAITMQVCSAGITSVMGGSVPSPGGTVNLSATGAGTLVWYDAPTEGAQLATGPTYSPNVTATTNFYVESVVTFGESTAVPLAATSPFTGNTRGYYFTSPADLLITSVYVPTTHSLDNQNIAIVRFNGQQIPPLWSATHTNDFEVLFLTRNNSTAGSIPANVVIRAGDVIGFLASRGNVNSYAATGYSINIAGSSVVLTRLGMQFELQNTDPMQLWRENSGSISRVEFDYTPICISEPRQTVTAEVLNCTPPIAYTVSGGGSACTNIAPILVSNSDLNIEYQLFNNNGLPVGSPVIGIGNTLDLGIQPTGVYTVVATDPSTSCTTQMTGSATVLPCFSGLGGGYCNDQNTPVILTGSEAPNGTFSGPGITDNGDGTALFVPSEAGTGGTVTYTVGGASIRPGQLTATTGSKSADAGGVASTSQNVAVYRCAAAPMIVDLDAEYCDLDESVLILSEPLGGFFQGAGISDNGDGTADFDPGAANLGNNRIRLLYTENYNGYWRRVSVGRDHSIGIKDDGTLWAWGDNSSGEFGIGSEGAGSDVPVQISQATDWATVLAASGFTVALKTDGTIWTWGNRDNGRLGIGNTPDNQPSPVQVGADSDWAQISATSLHVLALKTDGTLWAWGYNFYGQAGNGGNPQYSPIQIGTDNDWAGVSAGTDHSLALKTDGTLWTWGRNEFGQLGIGNNTNQNMPVQVSADTDWAGISAGDHSLALKTDGTLWTWGNNTNGQLGNGNTTNQNTPAQVGADTDWAQAEAGISHSLARKANGTLWAWGQGFYGQLGHGDSNNRNIPTQVGTETDWSNISANFWTSMGLKANGSLLGWGWNETWQLGDGSTTDRNVPTPVVTATASQTVNVVLCPEFTGMDAAYCGSDAAVLLTGNYGPESTFSGPGITDNGDGTATFDPAAAGTGGEITYSVSNTPWTAISAGADHNLALKGDGTLWGWGYNGYEVLGNGTDVDSNVPVQAGTDTDWAAVSAGEYHSLGIKTNGTLWAWGNDEYGEIGGSSSAIPVQIGTDTDWAKVGAGSYRSFGIKTNGTLWAWGYNGGVFGDGSSDDSDTPVQIGTDANWASVSTFSEGNHVLGVRTDGTLWAWGYNYYGELGNGTFDNSNVPVQIGADSDWAKAKAGAYHSLAIKTDGTLYAWGYNNSGELGIGNEDDSNVPVLVGTGWADISSGYYASLGIKTDGTLWGWGYNYYGQSGNGTTNDSNVPVQAGTATNWSQVAASDGFAVGLQSDGNLWAWGYNGDGYLGDGTFDDSSVPVQVGEMVARFTTTQLVTVSLAPNSISLANISAADCKNTTCTEDDTFTADVTVTFAAKPASGTLSLSGPTLVGSVPPVHVDDLAGNSHTFTGVTMAADGASIELSATFSEGCAYTDDEAGTAPSCGGLPCAITDITLSNTTSCNDNSTVADTDDYFTTDVTVTFAYAPAGQTLVLTDEGGAVLAIKEVNDDLLCTTTWTFEDVQLPANGADVILTAGFFELSGFRSGQEDQGVIGKSLFNTEDCTFTSGVLMTAPQPCSCQPTSAFTDCPDALPLNVAQGTCSAIATYSPTANGNPAPLYSYTFSGVTSGSGDGTGSGSIFEVGVTTVTITAINDCGTAVCAFDVTVTDNIAPSITCPAAQTLTLGANCSASLPNYTSLATTGDNCGVQSVTQSPAAGTSVSGAGNMTVTLTVTDVNGLTNTCSFTVNKVDNTAPSITCPATQTLFLGPNCTAALPDYLSLATTGDNCGLQSVMQSPAAGTTVSGAGNMTVTLTVTDVNGLTNTCSFTVNKVDNTPPTLQCFNQTLIFNGEASFSLDTDDLTDASDNCGVQSITLSPNIIYSEQVGQTVPVVATVTDINGNVTTCTAQITVSGLPSGWSQQPDGIGCAGGNNNTFNSTNSVWTATSTNCFYGPPYTSDASSFAQRTLCGDGSITARVTSVTGGGWAGVVMRESNAPGAKKMQFMTNLSTFHRREFRTTTNGQAYPAQLTSLSRYWLRIVRTGNQFTLFSSPNGSNWFLVGSQNIVMNNCIQMGLVVSNLTSNSSVTATFAGVSYTGSNAGLGTGGIAQSAESVDALHSFEVYPNPTSGELNVNLSQYIGRSVRMEVYSIEGKLLQFTEIEEVQAVVESLNLAPFENGMYLVKVKSAGWPDITKRVVLARE